MQYNHFETTVVQVPGFPTALLRDAAVQLRLTNYLKS